MSIRQLRSFASDCVDLYATYDKLDDFYSLIVTDLPDFVQHEFASMIMSEDNSYASEATGPDNKHWESKMLPALQNYMKNSTDPDEGIEFKKIWLECVTDYMRNYMQELLDDAMGEFNDENGFSKSPSEIYGVPAHGPI